MKCNLYLARIWCSCLYIHCSADSSITLCKLQHAAAVNELHIYLEGKVSGVRQRVQAPTISLNLTLQLAPTPLRFPSIISYPSFPRREAVPKWLITVTSALSQELVRDYTHLTHLDNCIKYLCWWTDTKYFAPNKEMLQAERLTVRPWFQRDSKPRCTSDPLPSTVATSFLPLTCPFAGVDPSIPAASQSTGWKKWSRER